MSYLFKMIILMVNFRNLKLGYLHFYNIEQWIFMKKKTFIILNFIIITAAKFTLYRKQQLMELFFLTCKNAKLLKI